jgi:hypothetical protein
MLDCSEKLWVEPFFKDKVGVLSTGATIPGWLGGLEVGLSEPLPPLHADKTRAHAIN